MIDDWNDPERLADRTFCPCSRTQDAKHALRRRIMERRGTYSDPVLSKMSVQITRKVLSLEEYQKADTVFAYMDLPGEVQTRALIVQCLKDGKKVAIPRIMTSDESAKKMHFYQLDGLDHLVRGAMNIPEPDPASSTCLDDEEEALMVMPGVVFDRERNRIGYGKGFYDRYLQLHARHFCVAVAYDFQVVEAVPHEETDIRPQVLITPTETIRADL